MALSPTFERPQSWIATGNEVVVGAYVLIERACACNPEAEMRRVHLVRGEEGEVDCGIDLEREVRKRLHAVDDDERAGGLRLAGELRDVEDRSRCIRRPRQGDEARSARQKRCVLGLVEIAEFVDGDDVDLRAEPSQPHPWRDVRLMVGRGDHDAVAADNRACQQPRDIHCDRRGIECDPDALARHVDECGKIRFRFRNEIGRRARAGENPTFLSVIVSKVALYAFERGIGELRTRRIIG